MWHLEHWKTVVLDVSLSESELSSLSQDESSFDEDSRLPDVASGVHSVAAEMVSDSCLGLEDGQTKSHGDFLSEPSTLGSPDWGLITGFAAFLTVGSGLSFATECESKDLHATEVL